MISIARTRYTNGADAFSRSPAFLNWDRRARGGAGGVILQESRAWIAGLSDECGAGPAVAIAAKNAFDPAESEVDMLVRYIDETLWGSPLDRSANLTVQDASYGVRASMFYADKPGFPYTVKPCWGRTRSETRWRSYNYPHVTVVYWAMYRVFRNHCDWGNGRGWEWYLGMAVNTTLQGMAAQGKFNEFGLMAGTVWSLLLGDLDAEATATGADDRGVSNVWAEAAVSIRALMKNRAEGLTFFYHSYRFARA